MRKIALSLMMLACFSGIVEAANLDVVEVAAPAINCKFDTDCTITVSDVASKFSWPQLNGQGFLQSRTWPIGQPGTPGAKLYAYLYRVDVTQWQGHEDRSGFAIIPCVKELRLPFGPIAPLDYNGDGHKDQVFVITKGGLGSVKPSTAVQNGNQIVFTFFPPVCGHITAGKGQTTFFIGMASTQPSQSVVAQVVHDLGPKPFDLKAQAPKIP
jgi:hypothetical protein